MCRGGNGHCQWQGNCHVETLLLLCYINISSPSGTTWACPHVEITLIISLGDFLAAWELTHCVFSLWASSRHFPFVVLLWFLNCFPLFSQIRSKLVWEIMQNLKGKQGKSTNGKWDVRKFVHFLCSFSFVTTDLNEFYTEWSPVSASACTLTLSRHIIYFWSK